MSVAGHPLESENRGLVLSEDVRDQADDGLRVNPLEVAARQPPLSLPSATQFRRAWLLRTGLAGTVIPRRCQTSAQEQLSATLRAVENARKPIDGTSDRSTTLVRASRCAVGVKYLIRAPP